MDEGVKKWLVLIAVVLGLSMDLLDMTIINVAIPNIMLQFGADLNLVTYIVTAYMVTVGVFEPITAYLADTRGTKKIYIFSLILFTLSSVLCALAWDIRSLIFFRIVQAVGGGMILPLALSIVEKTFSKQELPLAMGLMGIPLVVAPALGPTIGGYFVEHMNWRWIFWLNLPLGLLAIASSELLLTEFKTIVRKMDIAGFLLSAVGFATLLLALQNGAEKGWLSGEIISLFLTSIVTLSLFFLVEKRVSEPLLELTIFKNRIYSASIGVTFFFMMTLFGSLFLLPMFMQQLRGYGAMDTGIILLPEIIGAAMMIPVSSLLLPRIGAPALTIAGTIIMTLGSYPLSGLQLETEITSIETHLFVIGCGMGLGIMPAVTLAYSTLPEELVNQGSAFLNMIRQVGSAMGVAILTSTLDERIPVHYAELAESVTPWSKPHEFVLQLSSYFQQLGYSAEYAGQLGLAYIAQLAQLQASVLAYQNAFFIAMLLGLFTIIPALFLYRPKQP